MWSQFLQRRRKVVCIFADESQKKKTGCKFSTFKKSRIPSISQNIIYSTDENINQPFITFKNEANFFLLSIFLEKCSKTLKSRFLPTEDFPKSWLFSEARTQFGNFECLGRLCFASICQQIISNILLSPALPRFCRNDTPDSEFEFNRTDLEKSRKITFVWLYPQQLEIICRTNRWKRFFSLLTNLSAPRYKFSSIEHYNKTF